MSSKKILITRGRVIDPANGVDGLFDVEIVDGKIDRLVEGGHVLHHVVDEDVVVDANGCIVVPGLIDIHAHVFEHATVLGVNPDKTCLARGSIILSCGFWLYYLRPFLCNLFPPNHESGKVQSSNANWWRVCLRHYHSKYPMFNTPCHLGYRKK